MFKRREGFTLLEVILVIALIGIIIPAIYSIFSTGNTSYGISKNRGFAQQDVRLASDFIASNLKYVTALSDDENEFYTDYYSLKIIQNSDKDVLALIHNVRDDKGTETLEDDTIDQEIIKQISGVWDSILISYTKEDKIISSTVSKTEGSGNTSSRFELPIDTQSINSSNLSTNISVELYDGEAVYFRDAKDVISKKSIYITDSSEAEDEDTVKVNYYSNGTLYRSDFVARGNTITLAGIEDDFFKGWSRNEDLSGVLFTSLTIFEDTNLYAVWEMGDTDPEKVAVVNSVKILHDGNYKGPNEDNDRLNIKKGVDSYSTKFWITGENLQGIDFELRAEGIKADSLEHKLHLNTNNEIIIDIEFSYKNGNNDLTLIVNINNKSYNFYIMTNK